MGHIYKFLEILREFPKIPMERRQINFNVCTKSRAKASLFINM